MRAAITVAFLFLSAAGVTAQQEAPSEAIVSQILGQLPSFGAKSGRSALKVTRAMALPNSEGKAHFIEVQWQEAGKTGTALTLIALMADAPAGVKWLASSGAWGLVRIDEAKNWDDLVADMKRARISANESAALGNIRSMMSAQLAFGAEHKGFAPEVRCLVKPANCIPGAKDLMYIDRSFLEVERSGYRYSVHPGVLAAESAPRAKKLVRSFAFVAVPIEPNTTGRRAFCGHITSEALDYSFCATEDGSAPIVKNGQCQTPCAPVN